MFLVFIIIAFTACIKSPVERTRANDTLPVNLILDTDIAADCDDVGAVAVLHALADQGEVNILGMMVSMPVEYGAPALDAINTYFNRPDIPIGTLKNSQDGAGSGGLKTYNVDLAKRFPNDLKHSVNAENALTLYRKILCAAKDSSVTILTIGPLTNLYHLMNSAPDTLCELNGMELIQRKVKRLVTAGGRLPEGSSYNFWMAPEKTEYVINNWPTPYSFAPNQLGDSVLTGRKTLEQSAASTPVKVAYSLYQAAHPTWPFRPSWDQMGVLVAVRGHQSIFSYRSDGQVVATRDKIRWQKTKGRKLHRWYSSNMPKETAQKLIEELMTHGSAKTDNGTDR